MVRFWFAFFVVLCLSSCSISRDADIVEQRPLEEFGREWLDSLCSQTMMGRRFNTIGDSLAYDYLFAEIEQMGYAPQLQAFTIRTNETVRNIIVTLPGLIDSTIIIGAHYDGAKASKDGLHYPAANDNGSGCVAILLYLLQCRKDVFFPDNRKIVFCFWDAEEYYNGHTFLGSSLFVDSLSEEERSKILLYVNLDCLGHQHLDHPEIYLDYFGNKRMESVLERISPTGQLSYTVMNTPGRMNSDHVPFVKAGIPYVCFHDHNGFPCENPSHSISDIPEAISIKRLLNTITTVMEIVKVY